MSFFAFLKEVKEQMSVQGPFEGEKNESIPWRYIKDNPK